MKKVLFYFASLAMIALAISCGNKQKPVEITELATYTDQARDFSIQYPKNWSMKSSAGKQLYCVSSEQAAQRFLDYKAEGFPGGLVSLNVQDFDSTQKLEDFVAKTKKFDAGVYSAPENVTIAGLPATKLAYKFDLDDGAFQGEKYFVVKEKVLTTITFEAFGGAFEKYKPQFGNILATIKPAGAKKAAGQNVAVKEEEQPYPSETFRTATGNGFQISIPDNFQIQQSKTGNTLYTVRFMGTRRADCTIQVDVIDAKKQTDLNKWVEDYKGVYRASGSSSTKVGNLSGAALNYNAAKGVKGRVYLALKGNKLYRVTLNWFSDEEAKYLPIFEKCTGTLKAD